MPRRLLRSPGRLVGLVATLTLVVPAASGCAPPIDPQTAAAEGRSFAPIAVRAPGPASLVVDAFAEVPLDPAQRRAVATLAAETARRHAAVGQAMKEAASALASQIEVGKVDRGIMQTHVEAIAAAWVRSQPRDRDAIQDLHELLDIEQRQLLADAIEDRAGDRFEHRSLHAKWGTWKDELALSEEQADALRDAVRERARLGWDHDAPWRRSPPRAEKVLEAFVEEGFHLDEELPAIDARAATAARASLVLDVVEAALPHLTPEQRKIAAERVRRRGDQDLP